MPHKSFDCCSAMLSCFFWKNESFLNEEGSNHDDRRSKETSLATAIYLLTPRRAPTRYDPTGFYPRTRIEGYSGCMAPHSIACSSCQCASSAGTFVLDHVSAHGLRGMVSKPKSGFEKPFFVWIIGDYCCQQ